MRLAAISLIRWLVWVGIGLFLGLLGALYYLLPRLSVSPSGPINPSNASSSYFVISNDGYRPIHDVKIHLGLGHIHYGLIHVEGNSKTYAAELCNDCSIPEIDPTEKHAIPTFLPTFEQSPLTSADITVIVYYRPDFWLWTQRRMFRFVTAQSADGHLYWMPEAISSRPLTQAINPKSL